MSITVSITSQGQISIPASIRKILNLHTGGKAVVSVQDGKMIVEPTPDFMTLKGSLQSKKPPLTNQKIHSLFAQNQLTRSR